MPAPVDTSVRVPDSIRRASERASEMIEAQRVQRVQPQTIPLAQEGETPVTPNAQVTPAPAPQVTPESNWENNFKAMKGRFDRQTADMRAMSEQLSIAQQQLAQRVAPARSDVTFAKSVTPQEETEYGTDFLGVVGKKAKDELLPEFASMRAEIEGLKSQLGGVSNVLGETAQQRMYATLDEQVPSWKEINKDQNFINWLLLTDRYSGSIRQSLLTAAFARNDASRVAAFFQGFLNDEATRDPTVVPAKQTGATPQKVKLEDFAAPGRAKQAAVNTPPEKPIISRAQIVKHYADSSAGKYRGREAEYEAMERAIFDAQRDGRIS